MDQVSEKPSMRFLSFANDKEDAEKEAKLKEAALKIEEAISKEKALNELIDYVPPTDSAEIDPLNDTRSLYERLQEQKNKKKDSLEESQKLSNCVTKLDEEDVNYLNEVARNKHEEELKKRLEVYDALEGKKRRDEKKMLEEENRRKELLIGSRIKNSPSKSKLLLSIKVKPKTSIQEQAKISQVNPAKEEPSDTDRQTRSSTKRLNQADKMGNKRDLSEKDDSQRAPKREKKESSGERSEDQDSSHQDESNSECTCSSMNVMRCIGILPSLPIIDHFNSSDSDSSVDDPECRVTIKMRSKQ